MRENIGPWVDGVSSGAGTGNGRLRFAFDHSRSAHRNLQCNGAKLQDRSVYRVPLSGSPLAAQTGEGLLRLTRRSGPSDSDVIYVRCMRPERDGTGTRGSGVELRHCYAPRFPSHIGRAVHIMAQMMRCERGPDMQLRWATGHNSVATPSGHASNDRVQIERAVVSERPGPVL